MKGSFCLFYLLFLFTVLESSAQKAGKTYVEGISYLDQTPIRIEIVDGKISKVSKIKKLSDQNSKIYVAPGLFDNQINGFKGISFTDLGGELTYERILVVTKSMWENGITTYLPTITSNEKKIILKNFALLAKVKEDPSIHGSIPGFHLEGPYISPVAGYRGAHGLKFIRKPDWNEFMEFYNASKKGILEVTLAPEVEGAMDFITKCREKNIVVGLGHHNGSLQQVTEAADRGAQICTHLGNGCANMINRHDNPIWPQLSDDRLMISIIGDGFHLQSDEIRVFYKVKGPDKMILTSDVSPLGGLPPGKYLNAVGDTLEVIPEGVVIYPAQKVLSGSASALPKGVGNVMKVTGCSLAQVIQMASTNPARLCGLKDRGEIKPGLRADLILFTMDNFKMSIKKTMVAGELVYDSMK